MQRGHNTALINKNERNVLAHTDQIRSQIRRRMWRWEKKCGKKRTPQKVIQMSPCKVKRKNIIHIPKILMGMKSNLDPH